MFVCCECCVLSGRGLCDELIIRSEESYRPWCVVVCDQETSQARRLSPIEGCPLGVVAPGEEEPGKEFMLTLHFLAFIMGIGVQVDLSSVYSHVLYTH